MISILSVVCWFGSPLGRVALGAAALAAVVIWRQVDKSRLRAEGRQIERQATEKANAQAAKTAARVRTQSRDSSVRGPADPYVID